MKPITAPLPVTARADTHPTLEDTTDTQPASDDGGARHPGRSRRFLVPADRDAAAEAVIAAADVEEEGAAEATGRHERMPTLWAGRRRHLLAILFLLGLFQAVMALVMAFTVDSLLGAPAQLNAALNSGTTADGSALDPATMVSAQTVVPWTQLILLGVAVLSIFGARWAERVVGEDLGQDYVYELRRKLIGTSLAGAGNPSLGVTITRASNDLTAVRNWVSQGIVPLMTSLPLVTVVLGVLSLTNWQVGLAVGVPIVLFGLAVPPLAKVTFARARALRRRRGRMSARIADTVRAGESIQAAGGVTRELNALDRDSGRVVGAAVARARITGLVRACAITAASLATAAVVVLGSLGLIDAAGVASSMTLVGVMTTPLGDLGRVVEYRQNYRAARRIQAPLLAEATALKAAEKEREQLWKDATRNQSITGPRGLKVGHMVVDGERIPPFHAAAGDVVRIHSRDPGRVHPFLLNLLAGQNAPSGPGEAVPELEMIVDGYDYTLAPGRQRRKLLGHASARVPLERGTVSRAITYRKPSASDEETGQALARVGLDEMLQTLPQGADTRIKNGGNPLTGSQAARLKLGRALLDDPPLLVLDGIDTDLDEEGLAVLRRELEDYPGVVLFTSQDPQRMAPGHRVWTVDAP